MTQGTLGGLTLVAQNYPESKETNLPCGEEGIDDMESHSYQLLLEIKNELQYARLVRTEMVTNIQSLTTLAKRIEELEQIVKQQVEWRTAAQKTLDNHEKLRQRGIGIVSALTLVIGFFWAIISLAASYFTKLKQ